MKPILLPFIILLFMRASAQPANGKLTLCNEESLRIINSSIPWAPATKDGVPVRSYKIQPITYKLARG